jgi:threonyl-tRNA synthetase
MKLTYISGKLGKKIRNAKNEKIPYLLVVGDKEIESNGASVESRDKGALGTMSVEEIVTKLTKEIKDKSLA